MSYFRYYGALHLLYYFTNTSLQISCGSAALRYIQNTQSPKLRADNSFEDIKGAAHHDICRLMLFKDIKGAAHRNIILNN
jgi:predicted SprT family Zn-dependent metalloprotease